MAATKISLIDIQRQELLTNDAVYAATLDSILNAPVIEMVDPVSVSVSVSVAPTDTNTKSDVTLSDPDLALALTLQVHLISL